MPTIDVVVTLAGTEVVDTTSLGVTDVEGRIGRDDVADGSVLRVREPLVWATEPQANTTTARITTGQLTPA
jgi:hypothetical protein